LGMYRKASAGYKIWGHGGEGEALLGLGGAKLRNAALSTIWDCRYAASIL
jgi:hypothetical protein